MLQEPFAIGKSFIHQLDPRARIAAACVYSIVVAVSRDFTVLLIAGAISITWVILAKLPVGQVIKRVLIVNTFILLLWIVLPLTFRGPAANLIGPLRVYHAGIVIAAQITLKSNAILLALIALIATMTFSTLGYALSRMPIPDKFVHLLLMTYRYIFVIEQEYQRLIRAVQIRGFRPRTNMHTYKTYAYIIGMLFVRSSLRADRVYKAMLCRGFKNKFYCLQEFSAGCKEWIFITATGIFTGMLAYLEWLRAVY